MYPWNDVLSFAGKAVSKAQEKIYLCAVASGLNLRLAIKIRFKINDTLLDAGEVFVPILFLRRVD